MTQFLYLVRHGEADPHDGPLSQAGERQAQLTGQRLTDVPFSGIYHGPLPRAAQTAGLIAASLPGVPVCACDLVGDHVPFAPDSGDLPPGFASFVAGFSAAELADGPKLAAAALERFAGTGGEQEDTHELIVTHNFLIGWFVSQALGAPPWRWLGLNQMNCALTVIAYLPGLAPGLISFNDAGAPPARAAMDRVPRRGKTCLRLTAAQPGGRVTKSAALRSAGGHRSLRDGGERPLPSIGLRVVEKI